MAGSKNSEAITEGLVFDKLSALDGYSSSQNGKANAITRFRGDSYKGTAYECLM